MPTWLRLDGKEAHGGSLAAASRLEGGVSGPRGMIRNVGFLLGGYLASWAVSLVFWLVVPRIIGPTAWGEFNLGGALASVAFAVGGLGITTFLVKEISRNRDRAHEYVGAGIAIYLVLATILVSSVVLFTLLAPYSQHTRVVILLITAVNACGFVVAPAFFALQALERMQLASIIQAGRQVFANLAVVSIALIYKVDVNVLIVVILIANVITSLLQLGIVHRIVGIRLRFDRRLVLRTITGGLPFWSNNVFLTFYVWIDSVLLSMLVSTREVGYYAAPAQVVATLGFLPAVVTFAIFPALSSSFHADFERVRRLTRTSLSLLITLGLPISIGAALVGPNVIHHIFGPAYRPSGPTMVVLALTIVPGYIAILAYNVLAAVDRQRVWAYVIGTMGLINPVINFITIPYFQSRFGHGSIGAAAALLITDAAVCVAGLALIPRECLRPAGPLLAVTTRAALATTAMALPVWFLRDRFVLLPVLVGVVVFAAAALVLGVFRSEGLDEVWAVLRAKLNRRLSQQSEIEVPVSAATESAKTGY